jgi:DNA-binding HxlR family transcriptional regulator
VLNILGQGVGGRQSMTKAEGQAQAFRLSSDACPISGLVELVGERWTFHILRGAMLGLRHFEEFQSCLGIARNILSDRLSRLVASGFLARTPDPHDRRKVIYGLTEKATGMLPVMLALRQWGLDCGLGKASHPTLADKRDKKPVGRIEVVAHDGRRLGPEDMIWIGQEGEEYPFPVSASDSQAAA